MDPLATPRFPALSDRTGGYESWYLKAGEPGGGRAVWIRYTVHKRPGRMPEGSAWFTFFDSTEGRPAAVKQTGAPGALSTGPDLFVGVNGFGEFAPGKAHGRISGEGREASWEIEVAEGEPSLRHLPRRLYSTPLPRTKPLSLTPSTSFSGSLEINGRRVAMDGWPGMVGHNWGPEHAERWIWLHGIGFEGRGEDTWIDLAAGRVKVGPWTTPWVANGAISIDGVRHRLGGIRAAVRSTGVTAAKGSCSFELPGAGLKVSGTVTAPDDSTVAWLYSDPGGGVHHALNCSIAGMKLLVAPERGEPFNLEIEDGAVYEFGSGDTGHGIPLEPFSDG